ncbi:MAG: T9SS type A sorting domain-containing protein [Crocinitomicaceae bacterium]|nr:T9SS type A sorting domain-containing protein [Crocinitomicaceae bacterium]
MSKKLYLLLPFLCFGSLVIAQENTWDQKEPFIIKRERSATFVIGNLGYVCAGLDSLVEKDLWNYDPVLDIWSQLADLPGVARRNPVGFAVNGKGYVGTGHSGIYSTTGVPLEDFYEYDPVTNIWTQIANYPGAGGNGVYFATSFNTTNFGYVSCGKKGTANYEKDVWQYDPLTDNWDEKANFPGGDRYNLMSFVINDTAYVGFGSDQDIFRKDLWAFDEVSNNWEQRADCDGVARASGGTFSLNDRGFIVCGVDGGFKEDLWEYNPDMDRWKIRAYFPTDGRRYGVSFSINDKGYFGCGKGSFGKKRSMYEYTPMSLFGWKTEEDDEVAGILEASISSISIFPNPATDIINLKWDESSDVKSIRVYNSIGSEIMTQSAEGNSASINRNNLSSGIYYIALFDSNNAELGTHKIVLK